jgi:hypothetical protein
MIILFTSWLEPFPAIRFIFFGPKAQKKDVAAIGAREKFPTAI